MEVVIKIEVKDNNVEQALRVLKENFKETVFKVIKLKNTYEKPSEKKESLQENIKRVKKLNKLKNKFEYTAGWSSLVARQAHNLKVGGSNPSPATKLINQHS